MKRSARSILSLTTIALVALAGCSGSQSTQSAQTGQHGASDTLGYALFARESSTSQARRTPRPSPSAVTQDSASTQLTSVSETSIAD